MNKLYKALWIMTIWLLVPFGLGLVGYYVIGPRIGQTGVVEKVAPELAKQKAARQAEASSKTKATQNDPLVAQPEPKRTFSEPQVEVTVSKLGRNERRRSQTEEQDSSSVDENTRSSTTTPERRTERTTAKPKSITKPKPPVKEPTKPETTDPAKTDEGSAGGALPEGNTPPSTDPPATPPSN